MDGDPARRFFRRHVDDYETLHYGDGARTFMTVRLARILSAVDGLDLPKDARVLDAGCGPGHLTAALAARGFETWAVDTAPRMLTRARERVARAAAPTTAAFQIASIESLPHADGCFDLVCSAGVIDYLPTDAPTLREARRVLRPGGVLLLTVTNFWSPMYAGDFLLEFLKRRGAIRRPFNRVWTRLGRTPVQARRFRVRRHRPGALIRQMEALGLVVEERLYFHMTPWPRPLDRLVPGPTQALGARLERYVDGRIGRAADGCLLLARKPGATS